MPSAISHTAPAIAMVPLFAKRGTTAGLWLLGAACAMAPDLDVAAFALRVPYGDPFGHRGFFHSIAFAATLAAVAAAAVPRRALSIGRLRAWVYLWIATASHGLLDACTDGGLGVALLAPFDDARLFAPFRPIAVSPLGIDAFFSARGVAVLRSELVWVWIPSTLAALALVAWRRARGGER